MPDADRQKVIDEYAPKALAKGDAAKGKEIFKANCIKCHTHNGEGGKVGPDLSGMATKPKQELIVDILDPSRSVEGNFRLYKVSTTDGLVLNGLLASESKNAIEVLDAEGKTHPIQREDIKKMETSPKSLMPEGFEKQIPAESFADLLEFLTQKGKYLPLDLRKVATAVSTKGMFYSHEADAERLIFSDWLPKTFEGVPFQPRRPTGHQSAECRHAEFAPDADGFGDAEIRRAAVQHCGEGDPFPERRERLGRAGRTGQRQRQHDRPTHL